MAFPTSPTNGQTAIVNSVTYQYANSTNAWTRILSTANIITANTIAVNGNISAAGNVTGNYIFGNGSQLTGISALSASYIANGTSNVDIPTANGNVTIGIGGTGNVAIFSTTGEYITGVLSVSGNVTGGNLFFGSGTVSGTGTVHANSISIVGNVTSGSLSTGDIGAGNIINNGIISASGNITGNYFIGNGSQLTGIVTNYSNANVAAYLPTYTGNLVSLAGPVITTANVTANYFIGNGSLLSGITTTSIVVDDFTGDGSTTTYTLSTTPSSIDATTVNYNGAILLRNSYSLSVANIIFSSPPEAGSEIEVTTITGGVSVGPTPPGGSNTQVQFNDTGSFGGSAAFTFNKTSNVLSVTGNAISSNLLTGGLISAAGNITGAYILGNGSQLTGLPATYGNANVVANLAALGSNPVSTTGNITGSYIFGNGSQLTGITTAYGNANVVANLAALGSNPISTTGNITGGNLRTVGLITATGNITANNGMFTNIVNVASFTGAVVSITGNITAANATFANVITPSTGTGTAKGIVFPPNPGGGSGDQAFIQYYAVSGENTRLELINTNDTPGISQDDIYFTANGCVVANNSSESSSSTNAPFLVTGGAGIAKTLYVGGNSITSGFVSATGNVNVAGNVNANNGMFTNIVNVASHTGSIVSVTGNVTANNFNGNGSFLSNTKPQLFMITAVSDESTPITTGVAKVIFRAPYAMTLYQIPRASLSVASTSGNPTVDINKNGTSIFSTLLTIDANETTSVTAATPAVLSTTTLADDDQISIDIDVAGTGATGLKVTLYYTRT